MLEAKDQAKGDPDLASGFATKLLSLIFVVAGVAAAQSAPPRKDIPAIARAANGAIVSIVMSDKDGKPLAQGSGFVVSRDGLIMTNYHVIAEGSSAVVKLPDGAFYVVDGVLASDKARDVAVIKAHGQNFRTLTLGNSDQIQVGEEVVAIGNPLSLESTVSNGIVSGVRTSEELGGKLLQTTAPISPGSSGGPLFNMQGEVIGINTLYLKGGENLNFAIPVNDAKRLLLNRSAKLQDLPNELGNAATFSKIDEKIDEEIELQKTIKWINDSFQVQGSPVRDGRMRLTRAFIPLASMPVGEGDLMSVTTIVLAANGSANVPYETEYLFNLRDIDPNTLTLQKTPSGRYAFTARTTNNELNIDERVLGLKTNSITFDLDPNYGPRFIRAFKRAVILDGGKPSMF